MDVVQTLRIAQLKAENDRKSARILRSDVMNEAMQVKLDVMCCLIQRNHITSDPFV